MDCFLAASGRGQNVDHARLLLLFRDLIYTAYELGWRSLPFAPQLWQAFEVVSIVLETQAGWRRILGNLARAELHGPLELIERRVAQRLLRAVSIDRARTAR